MGIIPSPYDCYLVNRSLKTLELRMIKHQSNALEIAKLLENDKMVSKVIYLGLKTHSQFNIIKKQMKGYGGMISFYLDGDIEQTKLFLNRLKLIPVAESLGGVETLIEHPGLMTHASISLEERNKLGITDNLIRLSVGIENYLDIYNDINQSLQKIIIDH